MGHPEQAVAGDLAERRGVQVPLGEDPLHLALPPAPHHEEHPLLRLRQEDLVGGHPRLALRRPVEVHPHPAPAPGGDFGGGTGQPGGAHVLDGDQRVALHEFEAGLQQEFLQERVADLHRGPLGLRLVVERRGGHRRALDAVAAGLRPDAVHRMPRRLRPGAEQPVRRRETQREGVHQRVQRVAVLEPDFPSHGGDAHAVPVVGDAGDRPGEPPAVVPVGERAEAQRVHQRHRARAHGEDVPQDAADAGSRALVRLDEGGMVVGLHLEHRGQPVADLDGAGVLARPFEDAGRLGGEAGQVPAGRPVGAVLRPHGGEHAEFGGVRRAPEAGLDRAEVGLGETRRERVGQARGRARRPLDGALRRWPGHARRRRHQDASHRVRPANTRTPSSPPSAAS